MLLQDLKPFLLYCTLINYAILLVWFAAFVLAHDFVYRLHSRWFALPVERFDALHYGGMAVYKIGVLLLNLVPLLALCMLS
ncbi:hypothetical protein N5J43_23810 [Pseudomonas nicosulfuronedens]|uniref:DUF6868 domain-containing protein n=1 Tax=Pseudomonas nicosulfuronedens TaxID=2571105 RepID=A0A5R9QZA0_9PSED|nr:hypothetical protein [Pseudomonas nicosulfuronedens]MDH1008480.1 hypothetical protein [Pseudomonas nicosulfuronedens]MDH1981989.1 hypothetical protein [Pseudomonas nicosulfuronedens]MDH2030389.1 hypothetical protein [Pseudomonas nicosulfuronedens]TLX75565.1 hypothetical protein FAS41_16885 [Pseudomonas nicosulfuronedens]